MKNIFVFTVLFLLLLTSNYATADAAGCGTQIALTIQAAEKTDSEKNREQLTTKTTQTKPRKKQKSKSGNFNMFKLLIPDMRNK